MSRARLVLECGVAQTRAALMENDVVCALWFGPARGDENADRRPQLGRRYAGKVLFVDQRLSAAFVDIGATRPGFLPLKPNAPAPSEGSAIAVAVRRSPRGDKGATVSRIDADVAGAKIGPLDKAQDAAMQAVEALGRGVRDIVVDSGAVKILLEKTVGAHVSVAHDSAATGLFAASGAEEAMEGAMSRRALLPGGGAIVIDEAEALTAVDVDAGPAAAASSARLNERVNIEAAKETARQLRLRNIGGQVAIDFLPGRRAARAKLNEALKSLFADAQKASWAKAGIFIFTRPRCGRSLLEQATEELAADPISGRRFALDWRAKHALTRLEQALRAAPSGRARLVAGAALAAYLNNDRAQWIARLQRNCGGRFEIVAEDTMKERDFELSGP